jgi:3-oxoacyl-[acyl-carrier-protein] synthase II
MEKRVVITGLGVVSPIGTGVAEFWKAALAGTSGISAVPPFDTLPMEAYRSRVVGRVRDFDPAAHLDATQAERLDRYAQFGRGAEDGS